MELIEVINSSLIIFFSFVSVTAVFSYVTFKLKEKSRVRSSRRINLQVQEAPESGIYPRMFSVSTNYKVPGILNESVKTRKFNIIKYYSFNLSEKMHKLRLSLK
jgi:hypothetical protein